jgi:hypothetical protein
MYTLFWLCFPIFLCHHSPYKQEVRYLKSTKGFYMWVVHDVSLSLAHIGTLNRGVVVALVSYRHVSVLYKQSG